MSERTAVGSTGMLAQLRQLHPNQIDLTLERMHRLLTALGHPEQRLAPVVHVAGTNAKGSVIALLRAMLEADGRRVHSYQSPPLHRISECIRVAAESGKSAEIDEAAFASFFTDAAFFVLRWVHEEADTESDWQEAAGRVG